MSSPKQALPLAYLRLCLTLGRLPSCSEIAEVLGVSRQRAHQLMAEVVAPSSVRARDVGKR